MDKFAKVAINKLKNKNGDGSAVVIAIGVIIGLCMLAAIISKAERSPFTMCGVESDKAEKEDRSENNSQECYNAATSAISYSGKNVDLK